MRKKGKRLLMPVVAGVIAVSMISGCGNSDQKTNASAKAHAAKSTTTTKQTKKQPKIKKQNPNKNIPIGQTQKSKLGVQTVVARKEGLNKTYTTGPFKLTLLGYQVATLKPSKQAKPMFDGKSTTTIVGLKMKVENTSAKDLDFYPAQGILTTNTGAQAHAMTFVSDDVGGTFYGKVHKEGEVFFSVDANAKKINEITFIIDGPSNKNLQTIGKQLKIDIPIN